MPKSVQKLLDIVLIKSEAHRLDIISIMQKKESIVVTFKNDARIDPIKIVGTVAKFPQRYLFTSATNPYITVRMKEKDSIDAVEYVKMLVDELKN